MYAKYTTANNFPCITPLPHSKHIYDVSEIRIKGTVSVISSDPYFCLIVFKGPYISVKISEFLSLKETLIVYYENLNRIICRILKYFFQNNCFKNLDKKPFFAFRRVNHNISNNKTRFYNNKRFCADSQFLGRKTGYISSSLFISIRQRFKGYHSDSYMPPYNLGLQFLQI